MCWCKWGRALLSFGVAKGVRRVTALRRLTLLEFVGSVLRWPLQDLLGYHPFFVKNYLVKSLRMKVLNLRTITASSRQKFSIQGPCLFAWRRSLRASVLWLHAGGYNPARRAMEGAEDKEEEAAEIRRCSGGTRTFWC